MLKKSSKTLGDYSIQVTSEYAGCTVRHFLIKTQGLSKKKVIQAGHSGGITVNGNPCFLNYILSPGEIVQVRVEEGASSEITPEKITLEIIYEDEDILVVDKPPFQVVHPTSGYQTGTLANGIAYYWQEKGLKQPVRIINRLDRDTSGLILIANNEIAAHKLNLAFERGNAYKEYLALIHGLVLPTEGVINKPIGRVEGSIILRTIDELGQPAITHYKTIEKYPSASLVKIRLETGRTHQIRVHFASLGHPLLGESLYSNQKYSTLSRHGLHCNRLYFQHPRDGRTCEFTSPIPEDMRKAILALQR